MLKKVLIIDFIIWSLSKKVKKRVSNPNRYYIDNKKFLEDLKIFHSKLKHDPLVRIPDSIGKSIWLICENLGTRWNFNGYSYLDEMRSDAIEDCIAAVKNFDPSRFSNPLGYFTQIAWYAFLQRISTEKKQQYVKHKNFQNQHLYDDVEISSELSDQVIDDFERDLQEKSKAKKEVLTKKAESSIVRTVFKKAKKVK